MRGGILAKSIEYWYNHFVDLLQIKQHPVRCQLSRKQYEKSNTQNRRFDPQACNYACTCRLFDERLRQQEARADANTGTNAACNIDADSDADPHADADADANPHAAPYTETQAETDALPHSGTDANAHPETGADTDARSIADDYAAADPVAVRIHQTDYPYLSHSDCPAGCRYESSRKQRFFLRGGRHDALGYMGFL